MCDVITQQNDVGVSFFLFLGADFGMVLHKCVCSQVPCTLFFVQIPCTCNSSAVAHFFCDVVHAYGGIREFHTGIRVAHLCKFHF
jgi:hypothetical protein